MTTTPTPDAPAAAEGVAVGARRLDLDAARAARREAQGQHVEVVLAGEVYRLPVEMPLASLEGLSELAGMGELAKLEDNDPRAAEAITVVQANLQRSLAVLFCDELEQPADEQGTVYGEPMRHSDSCSWRLFYQRGRPSLDDLMVLWEGLFVAYGTTMGEALARIGSAATDGVPSKQASRGTTRSTTRGKRGGARAR